MDEVWNILFKKKKKKKVCDRNFLFFIIVPFQLHRSCSDLHTITASIPSLISFTNLVGVHVVCHVLITSIILSLS